MNADAYDLLILGCSGPGAGAAIQGAVYFAQMAAGVHVVLLLIAAVFSLRFRKWFWQAVVLAVLLAFHPLWFDDGRSGDCGAMLQLYSMIWIAISVPLVGSAIRSNRTPERFTDSDSNSG